MHAGRTAAQFPLDTAGGKQSTCTSHAAVLIVEDKNTNDDCDGSGTIWIKHVDRPVFNVLQLNRAKVSKKAFPKKFCIHHKDKRCLCVRVRGGIDHMPLKGLQCHECKFSLGGRGGGHIQNLFLSCNKATGSKREHICVCKLLAVEY